MSSYITEKCPKCGGTAYADGIDVGVGYYYEPLHCDCGWSEMCSAYDEENCKNVLCTLTVLDKNIRKNTKKNYIVKNVQTVKVKI